MNKKGQIALLLKEPKILVLLILTFLVFAFVFIRFGDVASIGVQGVSSYEKSEYWDPIDSYVKIEAPFLGTYSDDSEQGIYCKNELLNDGDLSVINDWKISSNKLYLKTYFANIQKRGCDEINEISAEFKSNVDGEINFNFVGRAKEQKADFSAGRIKIRINGIEVYSNEAKIDSDGRGKELVQDFFIASIKEGDRVVVKLESEQGYIGSGSSEVTISFKESMPSTEEDTSSNSDNNEDQQIPNENNADYTEEKISFVERLNLAISNFFKKLFGGRDNE